MRLWGVEVLAVVGYCVDTRICVAGSNSGGALALYNFRTQNM